MASRRIPKPDPNRDPLKVNIYRFVQNSTTALTPLFPYVDEGAIVPCAATFRGAPGRRYGRFQHFNTVDEVLVTFGAQGGERRSPGVVHVGAKLHTVVSPIDEAQDPDVMVLAVITQRQSLGAKEQREEYRFICDKCDRRLFLQEVDATPPKRGTKIPPSAPFFTIAETLKAAQRFNADEEARKCKHCGHQNPPFPIEEWAWNVHVYQSEIANMGERTLGALKNFRPGGPGGPGGPPSGAPAGARPGGH
jgi:hypothetical protein